MGLLPRFPRALQRAMNGQEGCLSTRCNRLEGSPSAPQPNRDAHAPAPEDRIRFPRRSHCLVRLHLRQRVSAPCISWSNPSPSAKATHSRLDASRPGRPYPQALPSRHKRRRASPHLHTAPTLRVHPTRRDMHLCTHMPTQQLGHDPGLRASPFSRQQLQPLTVSSYRRLRNGLWFWV